MVVRAAAAAFVPTSLGPSTFAVSVNGDFSPEGEGSFISRGRGEILSCKLNSPCQTYATIAFPQLPPHAKIKNTLIAQILLYVVFSCK